MKNQIVIVIGIVMIIFISGCVIPRTCSRLGYESVTSVNKTVSNDIEAFDSLYHYFEDQYNDIKFYQNFNVGDIDYKQINSSIWNGTDYKFESLYAWVYRDDTAIDM